MKIDGNFSNEQGVIEMARRARKFVVPKPHLLPSKYAEEHLKIPEGSAIPGPVRFRNAPYQVEPLDMCANPDVNTIALMWGAQTGKTQILLMCIAFFIDYEAQSQIMMQPTESDLQKWLITKFDKMVDSNDTLRKKMARPRGREGTNNMRMKQYIGGDLIFAWAGSASTQRGISAPKIYCDEVDGYDRSKEGLQVNTISERSSTFGDDRLLFITSTPTIKHFSSVEDFFLQGDQRRWYAPCQYCGTFQYLEWKYVEWKTAHDSLIDKSVGYVCRECNKFWNDAKRFRSTLDGVWRANREFNGDLSYHLPSMASRMVQLKDIVKEYRKRKAMNDLQTFYNTKLALTWSEQGYKTDWKKVKSKAIKFIGKVPAEVQELTIGVDVQSDRLEYEVAGWDSSERCWSYIYDKITGDVTTEDPWNELKKIILKEYDHGLGGKISVCMVCIDAGYLPNIVSNFCKDMGPYVIPVVGRSGESRPVIETTALRIRRLRRKRKWSIKAEVIGVDEAKAILYKRLELTDGPGCCYFPDDREQEYFEQLCSEVLDRNYVNGKQVRVYVKTRPRNEALDIRNYAYAAFLYFGPRNCRERKCQNKPEKTYDSENQEMISMPLRKKKRRLIR